MDRSSSAEHRTLPPEPVHDASSDFQEAVTYPVDFRQLQWESS